MLWTVFTEEDSSHRLLQGASELIECDYFALTSMQESVLAILPHTRVRCGTLFWAITDFGMPLSLSSRSSTTRHSANPANSQINKSVCSPRAAMTLLSRVILRLVIHSSMYVSYEYHVPDATAEPALCMSLCLCTASMVLADGISALFSRPLCFTTF